MAPANTGSDRRRRAAVMRTDQQKSGICSNFILFGRTFKIVVMKLIAPKIEDTPAK
jgi:hypothetical protein